MRKKSHISLARYIVGSVGEHQLSKHKKAFYLGSVLPDCKPSFLTTKHEINGTFEKVKEDIKKLTVCSDLENMNYRAYCRNLGEVIHYLADYFTYPHNDIYDGNLKDHCVYEKHLKHSLKAYIYSGEAEKNRRKSKEFHSVDALFDFIQKSHVQYLNMKKTIEEDCKYIVSLCHQVVQGILNLFFKQAEDENEVVAVA